MNPINESILLFKTNITTITDTVVQYFESHSSVVHWSIDTEDIDAVLKVVSANISSEEIISAIIALGFLCVEME